MSTWCCSNNVNSDKCKADMETAADTWKPPSTSWLWFLEERVVCKTVPINHKQKFDWGWKTVTVNRMRCRLMMCQAMANELIIWKHDHGTKPHKTRSGWNHIQFLNQPFFCLWGLKNIELPTEYQDTQSKVMTTPFPTKLIQVSTVLKSCWMKHRPNEKQPMHVTVRQTFIWGK